MRTRAVGERPWFDGIEGEYLPRLIENDTPVICVAAGPGSGKTTGIRRRVQRLVAGEGVEPDRIFVGTFTRAIAAELRDAVGQEVAVSTLHSLALALLRENSPALGGRKVRFLLTHEEDTLLYDVGLELPDLGDQRERKRALRRIQSDWAERRELRDAALFGELERRLRRYGAMLIGEVVPLAARALEAHDIPPGRFDHVIVDEYQDLTACEQSMIEHIWSRQGSLVALGDDDQSIYGFRYARPGGLRNLEQLWRGRCVNVEWIPLPENRRCGMSIVELANAMMAEAGTENDPMIPQRDEAGEAVSVHWQRLEDEICGLAEFILSRPDQRFLVLVPRRFMGYRLRDAIGPEAKTAFYQEVLERSSAQERFTLASLLADPDDAMAARAWLGFRGDTAAVADKRNAVAYRSVADCGLRGVALLEAIADGRVEVRGSGQRNIIERSRRYVTLRGQAPNELEAVIDFAFNATAADQEETDEKRAWAASDLEQLRQAAHGLRERGEERLGRIIDALRYRIATRAPLVEDEEAGTARVRIMTLHSAKGLEADSIVVPGLADQIIPGLSAEDSEEDEQRREEQRRLLYVALTRARNELVLSWSRSVLFTDGTANQIRRDQVITEAGERRFRLTRSELLPAALAASVAGRDWLVSLGLRQREAELDT